MVNICDTYIYASHDALSERYLPHRQLLYLPLDIGFEFLIYVRFDIESSWMRERMRGMVVVRDKSEFQASCGALVDQQQISGTRGYIRDFL